MHPTEPVLNPVEQQELAESPNKELTLSEYKNMMRQFFTVRRATVAECGHKYVPDNQPRHSNCEYCWFAFFQQHGELVQTADEVFQKYGAEGLDKIKGEKFRKNFTRFMSTLAKFQEEMAAQGANGENTSRTSEGTGEQTEPIQETSGSGEAA